MYLHASIFWRESCQKEFVWGTKVSKIFLSYPLIQWQNIPPLSQGNREQISASEIYSIGKILKRTHQKKVLFLSKCTASVLPPICADFFKVPTLWKYTNARTACCKWCQKLVEKANV